MSDSLTIVLILKDRVEFTRRWMSYMNSICCPYKILIADGGKDKSIEKDLTNHNNYLNLNFEYIRYPFDEALEDFWKKYHDVMRRVKTKYVVQADNDDFFILDRVSELLKILEDNSNVVGAKGSQVDFTVYDYQAHPLKWTPQLKGLIFCVGILLNLTTTQIGTVFFVQRQYVKYGIDLLLYTSIIQ